MNEIDYEAEGLLEGVVDDAGRAGRIRLLDYLVETEQIPLDELKLAARENRLLLLPIERALSGVPEYTAQEIADAAGVDLKFFLELRRSLGLVEPPLDERIFSEYDIGTMRAVKRTMELGITQEGVREINRVLGASMSQLAAAVERVFLPTFYEPEGDEQTIAARYGEVARITSPEFGFVLQHIFNLHLREQTRLDVLGNIDVNLLADTREITVCFADLVGFTSLGEQIPASELGAIAERLNEIAAALVEPPVRLVKSIGDAVMLVSADNEALVKTALEMVEVVEQEDEGFPQLSAGLEIGEALARGGDIYGPVVNYASRFCDMARPGAVVISRAVRDKLENDYDWTEIGRRRLKGLDHSVELFRVRNKGNRARDKKAARSSTS
ncbi:MAG: adenylate/guanylate cyclase domain-containing protein [Solirubrobacterales bacterium]